MSTRVKICGITRLEDAELAVELGAAALGFNFYPSSPRYIAPAEARRIIQKLPPFVTAVGVFADESNFEQVLSVARAASAAAIQLHGPRFPELDKLSESFPVIRAVAVDGNFKPDSLQGLRAAAFLLDAYDPARLGGTGKTFHWPAAREAKRYGPLILAGGLTPENVAEGIKEVQPFAVDVASGVESAAGVKDVRKLRAFFAAVAKADRAYCEGRIEGKIGADHGH